MQLAILIFKRSQSMPKAEWRLPATCRTLAPMEIESLVTAAWTTWLAQAESPALVVCLQDYHVVLCNETMPARLPEPRLIDLQADLY
jgi:hypothetical protein